MEALLSHIKNVPYPLHFINDMHDNVYYYSKESKAIWNAVWTLIYKEQDYWRQTQLNKEIKK